MIFSGQTITQFGLSPEYRNDLDDRAHIDPEKKWYRALCFREDRLVGGLLIGKGNRAGKRRYLDAIKSEDPDRQARAPRALGVDRGVAKWRTLGAFAMSDQRVRSVSSCRR